jgi:hypothetical protein
MMPNHARPSKVEVRDEIQAGAFVDVFMLAPEQEHVGRG